MRHHDHSTGKYYYHNTTTQQTVWEKPADYDGEDSDDGGAVLEMQQNPMRAASLHYGGDESTSSEEEEEFPPIAVVEGVVPKAQWAAPTSDEGDAASAAPTRKHIGGDWYENFDRASGKTYYVNTKTRETRWIWPKEVEKRAAAEKVGEEEAKDESTQQNFASPSEYLASLESRLKKIETTESAYQDRLSHLEEQEDNESASLAARRSMLFFGVKTLDPKDPVIVHTRAYQKMNTEERIADAAKHGAWPVIKVKLASMFGGGKNDATKRIARSDIWLHDALKDEDRLDWNTDLAAIEIFREKRDEVHGQETKVEDDERDVDLMFEMNRDDDPKDPAKYEASESLHLLTFYTCHQIFVDEDPLPQQWGRARFFLGFSFFVALMQNYVIYRLICLVALENRIFYGVEGFPNKLQLQMGNNIASPILNARQYVDYNSDFDPTALNPNGCTMNDYKELDYCDAMCDDKPCECDFICVKRLLTWGEYGMRGGGSSIGEGRHADYKLKEWHEYAALQYTTDSNWCHENGNRVFNATRVQALGTEDDMLAENQGYVGKVDDANTYPTFTVNATKIKRCIHCSEILASVRRCVTARKAGKGRIGACDAHPQSVISKCAGKMCPSSMQVEDTEVMVTVIDFPALMVSRGQRETALFFCGC